MAYDTKSHSKFLALYHVIFVFRDRESFFSEATGPGWPAIAHTAILENEEAYAYYKLYRTERKPTKQRKTQKAGDVRPIIKADRDQARVRQRYMKRSREELVDQLLQVEQQYAELHERYLAVND